MIRYTDTVLSNKLYLNLQYRLLALHILIYESEIWTFRGKNMPRFKSTEMKFFRKRGYILLLQNRRDKTRISVEQYSDKQIYLA